VHIAYQQVESLLPQVVSALFSGDLDFDCLPQNSKTTIEQSMQVLALLRYQLSNLDGSTPKFNTLREIFRRGYKQDLIYGNGLMEFGWRSWLSGPIGSARWAQKASRCRQWTVLGRSWHLRAT
jgi:hypothetical protein